MHLNFRIATISILSILILLSCKPAKPVQNPQLKDLVDKQAWQFYDSIERTDLNNKKSLQNALNQLNDLLQKSPYSNDSATHAFLEVSLANLYTAAKKMDSAVTYSERALPYFEAHKTFVKPLFICYKVLGIGIAEIRGNALRSNYYATKAASLTTLPGIDTILPVRERIEAAYIAANTNLFSRYPEQAAHFGQMAIRLAEKHIKELPSHYGRSSQAYVTALLGIGSLDSAKIYIDKEERWVNQSHYDRQLNELYNAKTNYFYCAKQYDSVLYYALKTDWETDTFQGAYTNLELYTLLNRPEDARKNLQVAESLLQRNDSMPTDMLNDFYHHKTRYEIRYGNKKEAEASFLAYDSLSEDLGNKERMEMAASIESEYNLVDKQNAIDQLNQSSLKAKEEIRQKNNILIITVLAFLLCTVVIIVLLLLARQRKFRAAQQMAEAQRDHIEMEQRLLRTQMEPHFIFNTLSAMQSFIHSNENDKAITYLDQFAKLLRTSLEHSRENYALVSEEIEALQNYISLQALCFGNSFTYNMDIYEGCNDDDIKIPPMLLQPFVENAIQHGVKNMQHKGRIDITIEKKEKVLHCIIRDNGTGINQSLVNKRKSLAIRIARERLEVLSRETKQPASIDVASKPAEEGTGTIVEIVIPFV